MPGITLDIRPGSKLSVKILDGVRWRIKASKKAYGRLHERWNAAEERTLAYLPEREADAKKRRLREEGKPQYTTIQIPYSYALQMAAHTYWTTVFMARNPVLQVSGRHGESAQQVQAQEALLDYQVQVGEMLVPWYLWLNDVGKYGVGITGVFWDERFAMVSEIREEEEKIFGVLQTGKMRKVRSTRRIRGYTGNTIYNIAPYNFLPDPRVPLYRFQKGEFCAIYNEISGNEAIKREARGLYTNVREALNTTHTSREQQQMSAQLEPTEQDFGSVDTTLDEGGKPLRQSDILPIYECYIELVPSEWGLGKSDFPEKWVFTVTSDYKTVVGAQPLGAMHDKFPFNVIELEPEAYSLVKRGFPDIMEPVQNTMDWLLNSHFYNVRKALNDQFIVDPSRVVMKDVEDPLPGGIIRLKPAAFGSDIRTVMSQLQVQDVTRANLSDMTMMLQIGERISGINDQLMGVLNSGGRKTATEVRTSSTFGINRLKTNAEYFSAMGWAPQTQMFIQNSQQYLDQDLKLRIVGDLVQEAGEQFLNVDPNNIQGFYDFIPVDGTLPVDRFAQASLWRDLFAQLRNFPQIMQEYDMGRIFGWVAQLAGLKNINQFKVQAQVLPDEELAREAERGNLVPAPAAPRRNGALVPDQVNGVGPSG